MTQEEKSLLLQDLSARLPYKPQIKFSIIGIEGYEVCELLPELITSMFLNEDVVIGPYLRPMSSMTEEEEDEYWNIINSKSPEMPVGEIPSVETIAQCSVIVLDWLLSKGFDVRGLIPMGLALEATEEMYNV